MILRVAVAIILSLPLAGCAARRPTPEVRYFYFLHGKIAEDAGPTGVSPAYGAYDYPGIVRALGQAGLRVESEVRPRDTDPRHYADKVAADIRERLAAGVPASHITVAGTSKGSVIASLVSTRLQNPGIRYVLIANCNDWLLREMKPRLSGEILSIYESSDDVGQSCGPIVKASPGVTRFSEIRLDTGLRHGFIYRPLPQWIDPSIAWARR